MILLAVLVYFLRNCLSWTDLKTTVCCVKLSVYMLKIVPSTKELQISICPGPVLKAQVNLCNCFPFQLTNLTQHYEKATIDIITAIPNPEFSGLAVIDWEKWFPQWDFPSSVMEFYRDPSMELVRQRYPNWDNKTLEIVAKLEFEQSAKALMEGTLLLGQRFVCHLFLYLEKIQFRKKIQERKIEVLKIVI